MDKCSRTVSQDDEFMHITIFSLLSYGTCNKYTNINA